MQHDLLRDVGVAIIGAIILGVPAYRVGIPLILTNILTGALLGSNLGLGLITEYQNISTLSEIGLVLLMFILGMEIHIGKLLQSGKAVLVNGLTQFIGCTALGFIFFTLISSELKLGEFGIIYLAVATALSSTLVVIKILSERMELDSITSRITVGILVIQDLWAIAFLAMRPNLDNLKFSILALSFTKAVCLIGVGHIVARFVLPRLFEFCSKSHEQIMILALAWCFMMCSLASNLGLSKEMGALVAGVSIASYPYHIQIAVKISALRDFFITLFFVALGLQIPTPTPSILLLAGAITFIIFTGRALTVFPVLKYMGYGNRAGLVPAINLAQVSEFSLVLCSLGVQSGHISPDILSGLILAFVFTTLSSSLFIPHAHSIFRGLNPLLEKIGLSESSSVHHHKTTQNSQQNNVHSLAPEITLLGMFREASSLISEIQDRYGQEYTKNILVIDYNPECLRRIRKANIACHYGDIGHLDTLLHLGIENSKIIACTIPDHILRSITNLKLLKELKKMAPNSKIIVTAETLDSAREMYAEGADFVFMPRIVASHHLADVLETLQKGQGDTLRDEEISNLEERHELIA